MHGKIQLPGRKKRKRAGRAALIYAAMIYTEADFERLSWRDCQVWGVAFHAGDAHDLSSDLVLDLDFIVDRIAGAEGKPTRYRVAPASLVFSEVTDLRMSLDWGTSGFPLSINPPSIEAIERECVPDRMVYPARRYYSWQIRFSWPPGAEIVFKSVGFTQTLRSEPQVIEKQSLGFRDRK